MRSRVLMLVLFLLQHTSIQSLRWDYEWLTGSGLPLYLVHLEG